MYICYCRDVDDEDDLLYGENDAIPALPVPIKPEKPLNEKKECHQPWWVLIYLNLFKFIM